jgi:hypothetical protein
MIHTSFLNRNVYAVFRYHCQHPDVFTIITFKASGNQSLVRPLVRGSAADSGFRLACS